MCNNFSMHYGAPQGIKTRAKSLRCPQTPAEYRFWQYVRNRKMCGYKFRRQHPVGNFITDFYCHQLKLVVEIDGNIHLASSVQKRDLERENKLKEMGLSILRFSNQDVFHNPSFIELTIKEFIESRKTIQLKHFIFSQKRTFNRSTTSVLPARHLITIQ